jgi:hypothetical protein
MLVSGQVHATASLPPGIEPQRPWDGRLGGFHSRSGRYGEVKNPLPLPGTEPRFFYHPARSLVAIPNEISRNERDI